MSAVATVPTPTRTASPTLARSSALNLFGSVVQGIAGFALVVVVTRRLPTGEAGAFLEVIAVFTLVSRSAVAGTDVGLVRFTSRFIARRRDAEISRLYLVALVPVAIIGSAFGLALWVASDPLAGLITNGAERSLVASHLRVMAPFVPVAALHQAVEAASRGFGTMLPSVVVDRLLRVVSLPVLVALAITTGGGAAALALAWAGPYTVALVLIGLWTVRLVRGSGAVAVPGPGATAPPDPLPRRTLVRRFWAFAWPRSFAGVFALTILWIDTLIVGGSVGSDRAAVYVAAVRWLVVGNLAANAVAQAFAPEISRVLAVDGDARARHLFQESAALQVLLAVPAYLTAVVFAPFLLTVFGDGYGDGSTVIAIAGIGFVLATVAGPVDTLLVMAGRTRQSLVNTGVALAVNVVANLALVPMWDIAGAALAWAATLVVANALPLAQMHRTMGAHPFGATTIRNLGVCAAAGTALLGARLAFGATGGGLALGVAAGGLVVVAAAMSSADRLGLQPPSLRADGAPVHRDEDDHRVR